MASQSSLGSMFLMKVGFISISICSNSASFRCRGKAAAVDLHVLRAQVRKLRVRSFIVSEEDLSCFWMIKIEKNVQQAKVHLKSRLANQISSILALE